MASIARELTMARFLLPLAVAVTIALPGCAKPPTIYRWGSYEQILYDMYMKPGETDTGSQIVKLNEDIERTNAEGKRVPPGVHAHLGFLYYQQGMVDAAYEEFTTEKLLFPESTVFIDGVLERMREQ